MTIEATVCHIIDGDRILLLKKSAGLFGEGRWNGVGGKLKAGETPEEGATREAFEESGLTVSNLVKHGIVYFYFGLGEEPDWKVHVFSTDSFQGEIKPSEEGHLKWFNKNQVPYKEMWQDDECWLPLMLEGKRFNGTFYFNEEGTELLDYKLSTDTLSPTAS